MFQVKISQLLVSLFMFSFSGSEDQELLVEESINHAKEAVVLDIKDGNSWCKFFPCVVAEVCLLSRFQIYLLEVHNHVCGLYSIV